MLYQDVVRCVNLYTMTFQETELGRRKKRISGHGVWVVTTGKEAAPSQTESDTSANAAATPKGVDPIDWVMAEAETPSRPSSAVKVEQRDNLRKVDDEKQEISRTGSSTCRSNTKGERQERI